MKSWLAVITASLGFLLAIHVDHTNGHTHHEGSATLRSTKTRHEAKRKKENESVKKSRIIANDSSTDYDNDYDDNAPSNEALRTLNSDAGLTDVRRRHTIETETETENENDIENENENGNEIAEKRHRQSDDVDYGAIVTSREYGEIGSHDNQHGRYYRPQESEPSYYNEGHITLRPSNHHHPSLSYENGRPSETSEYAPLNVPLLKSLSHHHTELPTQQSLELPLSQGTLLTPSSSSPSTQSCTVQIPVTVHMKGTLGIRLKNCPTCDLPTSIESIGPLKVAPYKIEQTVGETGEARHENEVRSTFHSTVEPPQEMLSPTEYNKRTSSILQYLTKSDSIDFDRYILERDLKNKNTDERRTKETTVGGEKRFDVLNRHDVEDAVDSDEINNHLQENHLLIYKKVTIPDILVPMEAYKKGVIVSLPKGRAMLKCREPAGYKKAGGVQLVPAARAPAQGKHFRTGDERDETGHFISQQDQDAAASRGTVTEVDRPATNDFDKEDVSPSSDSMKGEVSQSSDNIKEQVSPSVTLAKEIVPIEVVKGDAPLSSSVVKADTPAEEGIIDDGEIAEARHISKDFQSPDTYATKEDIPGERHTAKYTAAELLHRFRKNDQLTNKFMKLFDRDMIVSLYRVAADDLKNEMENKRRQNLPDNATRRKMEVLSNERMFLDEKFPGFQDALDEEGDDEPLKYTQKRFFLPRKVEKRTPHIMPRNKRLKTKDGVYSKRSHTVHVKSQLFHASAKRSMHPEQTVTTGGSRRVKLVDTYRPLKTINAKFFPAADTKKETDDLSFMDPEDPTKLSDDSCMERSCEKQKQYIKHAGQYFQSLDNLALEPYKAYLNDRVAPGLGGETGRRVMFNLPYGESANAGHMKRDLRMRAENKRTSANIKKNTIVVDEAEETTTRDPDRKKDIIIVDEPKETETLDSDGNGQYRNGCKHHDTGGKDGPLSGAKRSRNSANHTGNSHKRNGGTVVELCGKLPRMPLHFTLRPKGPLKKHLKKTIELDVSPPGKSQPDSKTLVKANDPNIQVRIPDQLFNSTVNTIDPQVDITVFKRPTASQPLAVPLAVAPITNTTVNTIDPRVDLNAFKRPTSYEPLTAPLEGGFITKTNQTTQIDLKGLVKGKSDSNITTQTQESMHSQFRSAALKEAAVKEKLEAAYSDLRRVHGRHMPHMVHTSHQAHERHMSHTPHTSHHSHTTEDEIYDEGGGELTAKRNQMNGVVDLEASTSLPKVNVPIVDVSPGKRSKENAKLVHKKRHKCRGKHNCLTHPKRSRRTHRHRKRKRKTKLRLGYHSSVQKGAYRPSKLHNDSNEIITSFVAPPINAKALHLPHDSALVQHPLNGDPVQKIVKQTAAVNLVTLCNEDELNEDSNALGEVNSRCLNNTPPYANATKLTPGNTSYVIRSSDNSQHAFVNATKVVTKPPTAKAPAANHSLLEPASLHLPHDSALVRQPISDDPVRQVVSKTQHRGLMNLVTICNEDELNRKRDDTANVTSNCMNAALNSTLRSITSSDAPKTPAFSITYEKHLPFIAYSSKQAYTGKGLARSNIDTPSLNDTAKNATDDGKKTASANATGVANKTEIVKSNSTTNATGVVNGTDHVQSSNATGVNMTDHVQNSNATGVNNTDHVQNNNNTRNDSSPQTKDDTPRKNDTASPPTGNATHGNSSNSPKISSKSNTTNLILKNMIAVNNALLSSLASGHMPQQVLQKKARLLSHQQLTMASFAGMHDDKPSLLFERSGETTGVREIRDNTSQTGLLLSKLKVLSEDIANTSAHTAANNRLIIRNDTKPEDGGLLQKQAATMHEQKTEVAKPENKPENKTTSNVAQVENKADQNMLPVNTPVIQTITNKENKPEPNARPVNTINSTTTENKADQNMKAVQNMLAAVNALNLNPENTHDLSVKAVDTLSLSKPENKLDQSTKTVNTLNLNPDKSPDQNAQTVKTSNLAMPEKAPDQNMKAASTLNLTKPENKPEQNTQAANTLDLTKPESKPNENTKAVNTLNLTTPENGPEQIPNKASSEAPKATDTLKPKQNISNESETKLVQKGNENTDESSKHITNSFSDSKGESKPGLDDGSMNMLNLRIRTPDKEKKEKEKEKEMEMQNEKEKENEKVKEEARVDQKKVDAGAPANSSLEGQKVSADDNGGYFVFVNATSHHKNQRDPYAEIGAVTRRSDVSSNWDRDGARSFSIWRTGEARGGKKSYVPVLAMKKRSIYKADETVKRVQNGPMKDSSDVTIDLQKPLTDADKSDMLAALPKFKKQLSKISAETKKRMVAFQPFQFLSPLITETHKDINEDDKKHVLASTEIHQGHAKLAVSSNINNEPGSSRMRDGIHEDSTNHPTISNNIHGGDVKLGSPPKDELLKETKDMLSELFSRMHKNPLKHEDKIDPYADLGLPTIRKSNLWRHRKTIGRTGMPSMNTRDVIEDILKNNQTDINNTGKLSSYNCFNVNTDKIVYLMNEFSKQRGLSNMEWKDPNQITGTKDNSTIKLCRRVNKDIELYEARKQKVTNEKTESRTIASTHSATQEYDPYTEIGASVNAGIKKSELSKSHSESQEAPGPFVVNVDGKDLKNRFINYLFEQLAKEENEKETESAQSRQAKEVNEKETESALSKLAKEVNEKETESAESKLGKEENEKETERAQSKQAKEENETKTESAQSKKETVGTESPKLTNKSVEVEPRDPYAELGTTVDVQNKKKSIMSKTIATSELPTSIKYIQNPEKTISNAESNPHSSIGAAERKDTVVNSSRTLNKKKRRSKTHKRKRAKLITE